MAENNQQTTLDIVIRMLADGKGAEVTKQQLAEVRKEAAALEQKQQRSPGEEARLSNAKQITEALKQQKSAVQEVSKEQEKAAASADNLQKKMAAADQAFAKQQLTASKAQNDKLQAEVKALEQYEQAKAKALEKFQANEKRVQSAGANAEQAARQKRVVEELKAAQAAGTQEEEKAGRSKERLKEVNQGLAASMGGVGAQLKALLSPLGAVVAMIGGSLVAIRNLIVGYDTLAQSTANFGRQQERLRSMRELNIGLAQSVAELAASYRQVRAEMEGVSTQFAIMTAEMLAQQRATEEIEDEKLKTRLAEIQAGVAKGSLSQYEANIQTAGAQSAARSRKEQRGLDAMNQRGSLLAREQRAQEEAREAGESRAGALGPKVTQQQQQQQLAAKDAEDVTKRAAEALKTLRDEVAILKDVAEGKGKADLVASARASALFFRGGEAGGSLNLQPENVAKMIAEREELIAQHQQDIERAKGLEAQESARLAALEKERAEALSKAANAEKERARIAVEMEKLEREFEVMLRKRNAIQGEASRQQQMVEEGERAKAAEARQKQMEGEARNWWKRAQDAREKGFEPPAMPPDLKNRPFDVDREGNVRWKGKGMAQAAASELQGMVAELSGVVDELAAARQAMAEIRARAKNDGTLVG
jgi:hypothetical protein